MTSEYVVLVLGQVQRVLLIKAALLEIKLESKDLNSSRLAEKALQEFSK